MAGVVGGITRLFQPTVGVLASDKTCRGLNPWYFLVGLHLVSVFFAYGPWDAVKSDLVCQWPSGIGDDDKTFCSTLCYNQRFPVAVSSAWALHLLVVLIVVALMKFVYVTVKKKGSSGEDVERAVEPVPDSGASSNGEWFDVDSDNESGRWRYPVYMLCIITILAATSVFMFVLLRYQMPAVVQKMFACTSNNAVCPTLVQCALTGRSDKQAILWAMACCSAATISLCVGYLVTHAGQACGFWGGPDGTEKAGAGHRSHEVEEGDRRSWRGSRDSYMEGSRGRTGRPDHQGDDGVGMAGCRCQSDGANCCCRDMACGCYGSRHCPCYFQASETGQSLNSLANKEECEGKLLRGDTEVAGERKEWRAREGRTLTREPLRTAAMRGRGSPGGGRGKAVKYVRKHQVRGKNKM